MIAHTTITALTRTHGGKKSAGRERVDIPSEFAHCDAAELSSRLQALWDEGYTVDVFVLAHRDRRKALVKVWFPANVCPDCRAARQRSQ